MLQDRAVAFSEDTEVIFHKFYKFYLNFTTFMSIKPKLMNNWTWILNLAAYMESFINIFSGNFGSLLIGGEENTHGWFSATMKCPAEWSAL